MFKLNHWRIFLFVFFSTSLSFIPQQIKSQNIAQSNIPSQSTLTCDTQETLFLGAAIGAGVMLAVWVAYSVGSNKWK